jgi:hypothetical protein
MVWIVIAARPSSGPYGLFVSRAMTVVHDAKPSGGERIRTFGCFHNGGFQNRCLRPLGHSSQSAAAFLPPLCALVNPSCCNLQRNLPPAATFVAARIATTSRAIVPCRSCRLAYFSEPDRTLRRLFGRAFTVRPCPLRRTGSAKWTPVACAYER